VQLAGPRPWSLPHCLGGGQRQAAGVSPLPLKAASDTACDRGPAARKPQAAAALAARRRKLTPRNVRPHRFRLADRWALARRPSLQLIEG